jgi:multicomponent Na+:H+ antiporter subunit G
MIEMIGEIALAVGAFFAVVGGIGMIRMPDVYNRIHAETICVVGGTIVVLMGILILKGLTNFSLKVLIIIAFVFLTNPVGSHAIARAAHKSGEEPWPGTIREDLAEGR